MHKIFIKAFAWNSSATFIYKTALLSHQILLYSAISQTLYGMQSTLFAIIYTIIALTNFGFEETLLPFFSTYSQSKQQFRQAWHHFIYHIMIIAIIALLLCIIMIHGYGEFLHNIQTYCNKNFIFIITIIFFIESIKKSLLAMMQLAFLNKQIAIGNLAMIITYIASVWVLFSFHGQITLHTIFIPMLITSTLEFSFLLYNFLIFYRALPQAIQTPKITLKVIFKQRIYNYINQIIKTIYSPNSITIFFAHLLGFQQAAIIKFFTNIITLSYTCISKSIGVTSGAAFSAMNQMPLTQIQSLFKDVTKRYFQMLLILSVLLATVVGYSYYASIITGIMTLHIILFFSISFLEHVSVTYEQLFISQYAARSLTTINLVGLTILGISSYWYLSYTFNQFAIVCIFIGVKTLSLWTITLLAKKNWGISFFNRINNLGDRLSITKVIPIVFFLFSSQQLYNITIFYQ